MAPSGYLSVQGIDDGLSYLVRTFPAICRPVPLPETSREGRTCGAMVIGKDINPDKRAVLFLGGMHARELVNPDLLLAFTIQLCNAYTSGTGLAFGGKTYDAATIRILVDVLNMYVVPLVNPDGRQYVLTSDPMWRKNRGVTGGTTCRGVDLNRNFDFLWTSGIGTSSNPCDDIYRGSAPCSEPETRNIRYLVEQHPNIVGMVDVHSFSEDILFPWGDDDSQSSTPDMNFMNPQYDGQRGTIGDTAYREYISPSDSAWYQQTGTRMRSAIASVRGRSYTVKPSVGLYPTTATSIDYFFSRHLMDSCKRKVYSYCIETGTSFQPPYSEAAQIIAETIPALIEFSLACMCAADSLLDGTSLAASLPKLRQLRDEQVLQIPQGRYFAAVLEEHSLELVSLLANDRQLHAHALELARPVLGIVLSENERSGVFELALLDSIARYLLQLSRKASPTLRRSINIVRDNLRHFEGCSLVDGLKASSIPDQHPRSKGQPASAPPKAKPRPGGRPERRVRSAPSGTSRQTS